MLRYRFRRGRETVLTPERGEYYLNYASCEVAGLGEHRKKFLIPGVAQMVLVSLGETKGP